jgi:hypothetical protein
MTGEKESSRMTAEGPSARAKSRSAWLIFSRSTGSCTLCTPTCASWGVVEHCDACFTKALREHAR